MTRVDRLRLQARRWARAGVGTARPLLHRALGTADASDARGPAGPTPRPGATWWVGTDWQEVVDAGLFDEQHYRGAHPFAVPDDVDALWHYATVGSRAGLTPNRVLDVAWYRANHAGLAAGDMDPLLHYLRHGVDEGRDPSPRFDTRWYLTTYPDVAEAGLNPVAHYLVAGAAEGRRPTPAARDGRGGGRVVLLVSGEPSTPGHTYRVEHLAAAIRANGLEAVVHPLAAAGGPAIADVDRADLVVLWRTAWSPEVADIVDRARTAGAAVAFDVDDLMVDPAMATLDVIDGIRSQNLTVDAARDHFERTARTASTVDLATTTTEGIATSLRRLGRPTWVLPNGFDDETLVRSQLAVRVRRASPDDGLVRLGYAAGSRTHQRDLATIAGPIAEVLRATPEARLVAFREAVVLDELPELDGLEDQIEWRDLVPFADLPDELARFDINLAPLEAGNPFCEAKSDLKHFEAALVDVPTVASPTAPFEKAIEHGVDGFLAADGDAWREALRALVADPDLRRRVGTAARWSVLWRAGQLRRARTAATFVEQAVGGAAASSSFELELERAARPGRPAPPVAPRRTVLERDRLRSALVTVVIPVHDYADVVLDALESVAAQTLQDLDLVVVDDASGDGSLAVVERWLDDHADRFGRVELIAHDANAGVACARNAGVLASVTPYVLPLDADNVLLPSCAERLLAELEGSAAAYAYPRIAHFGDDTELLETGRTRGYLPYVPRRLVGSNWIDAMALVRTDAWLAAGGYRLGMGGWEDYDLWCSLAELGLAGVQVAEDLASYRVHRGSMLHTDTHADDQRLARVHAAITDAHPWLRLVPDEDPAADAGPNLHPVGRQILEVEDPDAPPPDLHRGEPGDADDPGRDGELGERALELLPLLRCPDTGEALEVDPAGGVRSAVTGRRWPVVAGRPVLRPGRDDLPIPHEQHEGNPLPERAQRLIAEADGWVLHLSGGGTPAPGDRVIDVDGDLFDPTDIVGDAHHLPFGDDLFDLVVVMNAFEHYRRPDQAVAELGRVLRPGGLVLVRTAFLQPVHEAPHHYANVTRYGLEAWFEPFEMLDLVVSDNFHPGHALAWLASDNEAAIAADLGPEAAETFRAITFGTAADWWRDPGTQADDERWEAFSALRQASQERLAAGFEYLGRNP